MIGRKSLLSGYNMSKILQERLLKKVNKTATCWLWMGKTQSDGYGEIWHPEKKKLVTVHKLMYQWFNGEVPEKKFVCHTCDVRNCVNPKHLWVGTNRDNIIDAAKKGRVANQILTQKSVFKIRQLAEQGVKQDVLAKLYNVSRPTIGRAINRKTHFYV